MCVPDAQFVVVKEGRKFHSKWSDKLASWSASHPEGVLLRMSAGSVGEFNRMLQVRGWEGVRWWG